MPLTDLVRHLNAIDRESPLGLKLQPPFFVKRDKAVTRFAGLELSSRFLPVIETSSARIYGHTAWIKAEPENPTHYSNTANPCNLSTDKWACLHLEQIVRTLHILNYLTHIREGHLIIKLQADQIVDSASREPLKFEGILRFCGLLPTRVTLELDMEGLLPPERLEETAHLYREQGYSIAIHRFGRHRTDYGLLARLKPEIVDLDLNLFHSAAQLQEAVDYIHSLGAKTLVRSIDTRALRQGAHAYQVDLLQTSAALGQNVLTRLPECVSSLMDFMHSFTTPDTYPQAVHLT